MLATSEQTVQLETHPAREPWLEARRRSLGGSDSPKVLHLTKYGGALDVYADKLGLIPDTAGEREAVKMGLILEPVVADLYQEATGYALTDPGRWTIARHARYPHLHASPDRFIQHPTRGLGVLSIKTTSAYKRDEWTEEAPPAYQVQLQHEMLVLDVDWGAVAVLIGGQMFRYIEYVPRDDVFCQKLAVTLADFWTLVARHEPPPPDHSEACRKVLAQLYPIDSGDTIGLDPALIDVDEDYLEAAGQVKFWEGKKAAAENLIRAALKDASKGVLPNGVGYTNKLQTRKEFTMPETSFRVLRRTKKG